MSLLILDWALYAAHIMLIGAILLSALRIIIGPRAQDRVLGLDTLYLSSMLLIITFGMRIGSLLYLEAALIIGLVGFTATIALAKFLMRGEVIE